MNNRLAIESLRPEGVVGAFPDIVGGLAPPPSWGSPSLSSPATPLLVQVTSTLTRGLARHLLALLTGLLGGRVVLPWLAPIFAKIGWWDAANLIYTGYIFFCHQLPERAGQLFGYQVAWCWRNTAIYTSLFLTALLYLGPGRAGRGPRLLRRGIGWRVLLLCTLPVVVDGLSHMFGLRTDNAWFDLLTGGRFGDFSIGDTPGTLNWSLRLLTGGLFGAAAALFVYPRLARILAEEARHWRPGATHPQPAALQALPVG